MEQTTIKAVKRTGWSNAESDLLWETADEAQQQGLPLKGVFEDVALKTGRRPNSIRNYYYAQVKSKKSLPELPARFVPFSEEEVEWLMTEVLLARSQGSSVRACLQKLAGGKHSLMLRYQNKYRSIIKNRQDYVQTLVERLNAEGHTCTAPEVNTRTHLNLNDACAALNDTASRYGSEELAHACQILTNWMRTSFHAEPVADSSLMNAVRSVVEPLKNYLCMDASEQAKELESFTSAMKTLLGELEAQLP